MPPRRRPAAARGRSRGEPARGGLRWSAWRRRATRSRAASTATDEPHNNWAGWEGIGRAERSGLACDFWRHPEEALDRAAAIGCNAFRLSVEWARLEPRPGATTTPRSSATPRSSRCARRGAWSPSSRCTTSPTRGGTGEEFWLRPGSPDVFARHVARVVPALAPYCRRWVTINEPNIVTLMGWIEGAMPAGPAHGGGRRLLRARQPPDRARAGRRRRQRHPARGRGDDEHELVVGLRARPHAARPACSCATPAWTPTTSTATSTSAARCTTPPSRRATPGRRLIRRFFAAVSPYGAVREPGRGAAWARLRGVTRRPSPRRVVGAVHDAARPRGIDAVGFDWYDPVASHAMRVPGRRRADGRSATGPSGAPTGTWSRTRPRLRNVVRHGSRAAAGPSAVGRGERHGDAGARRARRAACRRHGPAPLRARAPRRRWSTRWLRVCRCAPTCTGRSWTTTSGAPTSRASASSAWTAADPAHVRWLDTDAAGDDAAGEFARVVAGLRAGDRSVLEPPA